MSPQELLDRLLKYLAREVEKPSWMHDRQGWAQSGPLATSQNNLVVRCAVAQFDQPRVCTVQLGLNMGDAGDGLPVQAQAEVTWFINGTPIRRVVSVSQGCSISGPTEAIDVRMYDVTDDEEGGFPPNRPYVGLISIAPGPRAATTIPPFLRLFPKAQSIAHNADLTVDVPDNAGVVGLRISWTGVGTIPPTVTMTDVAGTVYEEFTAQPGAFAIFVPLASGTTQIVIANTDNTNAVQVAGEWAIDG